MSNTFKVAIIGAGPAGSLLANLLLKIDSPHTKLEVTVFESEPYVKWNNQGGMVFLGFDTGIRSLSKAGLFNEFLRYARYDAENAQLFDRNLNRFYRQLATEGDPTKREFSRPGIDRKRLREILLDSLPEGLIKWGHRLKCVGEDRTLHFHNGTAAGGFDLIVGADGAWSQIRSFLAPGPENEPVYCGHQGTTWLITDAEKRAPDVYELVNKGTLYVGFESRILVAQALGDGEIWFISTKPREAELSSTVFRERKKNFAAPRTPEEIDALHKTTIETFSDYHPALRRIVESADCFCRDIAFFHSPENLRWATNPCMTMIGDAAHVMTPWVGEGANLSMTDAVHLAETIEEILKIDDSDGATAIKERARLLHQFEVEMRQRAAPSCQVSKENTREIFGIDNQIPNTTKAKRCVERLFMNTHRPKLRWSWWIVQPIVSLALTVVYDFGFYRWLF